MARPAPRLELLWWSGCPSTEEARWLVDRVLAEAGVDPAALEMREVRTDEEAERESFIGSPTIRVDGRDIRPPAPGDKPSLTCRLYRRRDGRISPLPDPEDLRDALSAALAAGRRQGR